MVPGNVDIPAAGPLSSRNDGDEAALATARRRSSGLVHARPRRERERELPGGEM
jgi:hypothetical protein